ncbi:cobalt transport protein [Leptolyngbya sp. Heron Island J]|uniref:energy-coupling factor transporter transmembrane component T family protein n=1 Tax=Leptolyngbya sp. Heron Island J TaxID=1385935 RepID=UPI0003B997B0|nr:CbiQ family ECF transporter T component [Leptolyngbya sp. Heron Island J]ESA33758.1 cobalt transport protein [Leptolyngbya sp. Heron Island J]
MDLLRSLPIGLYLEQPVTWLHRLDARVKLAWLLSFLLTPVLANTSWRIGLVAVLMLLTLTARIPWRVWRQQMGGLLILFTLASLLIMVMPDGVAVITQPRWPTPDAIATLDTPFEIIGTLPETSYRYIIVDLHWVQITQKSLKLAIKVGTLLFTLIYSTNLFLLTTAPEEITAAIEELMSPLRWFKLPVTEIALTLTLALRFIPLVLEEVQNLVRSVRTRAINWRKLGWRHASQIWLMVAERLLDNLLLRAQQIAGAMKVRGFTSPDHHQVQWHQLQLRWWDWCLLISLIFFWWGRFTLGNPT